MRLADLADAGSTVLESSAQTTYLSGPVFSADSNYTLFARVDDVNTFNGQLVAAGPQGNVDIGAPSLWSHDRLRGDRIAFNDNLAIDAVDFFASTG